MAVALTTDRAPTDKVNPPVTPANCTAVNSYDWDTNIAYAICMAESRGVATKDNAGLNKDGSTDYGLMQINSVHADMVKGNLKSLFNPKTNVRVAYALSHHGHDWTAWTTYNNGDYREFLK